MSKEEKPIVVKVPEDFMFRWPHIFTPSMATPHASPKYSHHFPAIDDKRFTVGRYDTMRASSNHKPLIVPGDDKAEDRRHFEALLARAGHWSVNPHKIISHRPCKLLVRPYWMNASRFRSAGWFLELQAIQIGGNLTEDKPLDAYIKETLRARRDAINLLLGDDDDADDNGDF
jgi:hypothetical protein